MPDTASVDIMDSLKKHADAFGLMPVQGVLTKCMQLYDTIMVRHGLMLVGEPYAGKTNCYQMLAKAMGDVEATGDVQYHVINPKAIKMSQVMRAYN